MAEQRYDKEQKQDAFKQAKVAKKIQQEDAARNHLQKAKLANLFLQKAREQAKEHANKEMEDALYKSQHGRSLSPLFQHVDATKSHCGGTRGVWLSVLQGVAECCRVLQGIAVRCSELRHWRLSPMLFQQFADAKSHCGGICSETSDCTMLQWGVGCCSVLQCVTSETSECSVLQWSAVYRRVLQCVTVCCSVVMVTANLIMTVLESSDLRRLPSLPRLLAPSFPLSVAAGFQISFAVT